MLPAPRSFLNGPLCTNRKSVCGQDSGLQVSVEDVKVWRRVTEPANGICPPATAASSPPLRGGLPGGWKQGQGPHGDHLTQSRRMWSGSPRKPRRRSLCCASPSFCLSLTLPLSHSASPSLSTSPSLCLSLTLPLPHSPLLPHSLQPPEQNPRASCRQGCWVTCTLSLSKTLLVP